MTALISTLKAGDTVIAADDLYGGTYRLFTEIFSKFGIKLLLADLSHSSAVEEALARNKPVWVIFETPTNPLLRIIDISMIAALARKHSVRTVVDNTFATPYWQNPLSRGADVVLHSATKYLGGHSDMISGTLVTDDSGLKAQFDFARKALGLNPSPFDCWLLSRSVKTLALRMEKHQENAIAVAQFLTARPIVKKVYYPGLTAHPAYKTAKKQMRGFGGMVSAEFNLTLEHVRRLVSSFSVFTLAESLGGVESLVDHPASMTHASIPQEERKQIGLSHGLVRFSVGIEDKADLLEDLERGLRRMERVL